MRFHEDGARMKALLGKVRQLRAGARTRSLGPEARSPRAPRRGSALIVASNDGRGYWAKLFPPAPALPALSGASLALLRDHFSGNQSDRGGSAFWAELMWGDQIASDFTALGS